MPRLGRAQSFPWKLSRRPNLDIVPESSSNSGYKTASSSYSWTHTCNGNYLLVGISMLSVAGSSVSSITYNGVNLTLIDSKASAVGAVRVEVWGLANPAQGANSIAVTLSASLDSIGSAESFTNVGSPEEINENTATNVGAADATVNVTTGDDRDVVVSVVATSDTSITVGGTATQQTNVTGALGSGGLSSNAITTPPATVTMSWTNVGAAQTWTIIAIALRQISTTDNITVAITGISSTASTGTVTPSTSIALTGIALTVSAGTVSPSISITITGIGIAVSPGSLSVPRSLSITGQQITISQGTLTPPAVIVLTGSQLMTSQGTMGVGYQVPPTTSVGYAGVALGGW